MAKTGTSRVLVALVLASCNTNTAQTADGGWVPGDTYRQPPVRTGETLWETPEFDIVPGRDIIFCHYLPVNITQNGGFLIREIHSYQMRYGHHVSLNYTTEPQPVGSHECTEEDMLRTRLVGAGNESSELMFRLPEGVVVRVPQGAQIILQSHYLNTSTATIRRKDAITALPPPTGATVEIADPLAFSDGDFAIPPRTSNYGRTMECTLSHPMNVVNLFGHMHEWATRLTVQHAPAGSNQFVTLYNEDATHGRLQNSPPMNYYDRTNAIRFNTGDRVRVSCDWNNTTDNVLRFPQEMCAAVFYGYPGNGFETCGTVIETRGNTLGDAGTMGMGNGGCSTPRTATDPCVRTCNTGNELGVGKHCTRSGGQCARNGSAVFCTADFDTTLNTGWCTKGCSDDNGCGSGARCVGDSRGRGCTPVECLDPDPVVDGGTGTRDAATGMDASRD